MFSKNTTGGFTVRIGKFFMFTDPCDKFFNFELVACPYSVLCCFGYFNFGYRK